MICQTPGCDEHYGCRLRGKGIQVHPDAMPTKPRKGRLTPTAARPDLAQVTYDVRPDGSKMPILNADGSPVRKRQALEQGHRLKELHNLQQQPLRPK